MEPQEFDLPIKPNAVHCQIYNEWTMGNTGTGPECRLIIQSPTGAAYYFDYPTFNKYYRLSHDGTPEKEIGDRIYKLLKEIITEPDNERTETWSMSVPIEHLELIRDYGKPIDMPKPKWVDSWWQLQKTIHEIEDDEYELPEEKDYALWKASKTTPAKKSKDTYYGSVNDVPFHSEWDEDPLDDLYSNI